MSRRQVAVVLFPARPWETKGKPWETMGNHEKPKANHGKPNRNHGKPWETKWKPWETMANHGKPGKSKGNHVKPKETMENHGKPRETKEEPWETMRNRDEGAELSKKGKWVRYRPPAAYSCKHSHRQLVCVELVFLRHNKHTLNLRLIYA